MSLHAARNGDPLSFQILIATFLDTFRIGKGGLDIPCPAIIISTAHTLLDLRDPLADHTAKEDYTSASARQLRKFYPDVFRCCLHFLAAPHSKGLRERVLAIQNVDECSCHPEHNKLMEDIHEECARFVGKKLVQCFLDSMGSLFLAFFASFSARRELFRFLRVRVENNGRSKWPRSATDLYPFGMHDTLTNISAWLPDVPSFELLKVVDVMHKAIIYPLHNAAQLRSTRDGLISILYHALSCYSHGQPHLYCELAETVLLIQTYIQTILDRSKECYVGAVSSEDIIAWKKLVQVLLDVVNEVDVLGKEPLLETKSAEIYGAMSDVLLCALRLMEILQFPTPDGYREALCAYQEKLDMLRCTRDRFSGLWCFLRLLHPFNHDCPDEKTMNSVCAHPGCEGTKLSRCGRNLPICSGCSSVYYCSRVCQKAAWKHTSHPHREVCKGLRLLSQRILDHPGSHIDPAKFLEICPGGGIDEQLASKLGKYLAGVHAP